MSPRGAYFFVVFGSAFITLTSLAGYSTGYDLGKVYGYEAGLLKVKRYVQRVDLIAEGPVVASCDGTELSGLNILLIPPEVNAISITGASNVSARSDVIQVTK